MIDATQGWGWILTETLRHAHFKKPKPIPPPEPVQHTKRPTESPKSKKRAATSAEIRALLAQFN